jgi:hypothetical protein
MTISKKMMTTIPVAVVEEAGPSGEVEEAVEVEVDLVEVELVEVELVEAPEVLEAVIVERGDGVR